MIEEQVGFQIEYKECPATVTEHPIKDRRVFYIQFTDGRKPLTITVGQDRKEVKFWTSIPQGRQQEAEQVGKLIAIYIRSKKK
jgi:hypothetical protein